MDTVWVVYDVEYHAKGNVFTVFTNKDLATRFFNEVTESYEKNSLSIVKKDNLFVSDIAMVRMFPETLWSEYPEST